MHGKNIRTTKLTSLEMSLKLLGTRNTEGSEEIKSIEGARITQLTDGFTQEPSGTTHNHIGKNVRNLATPCFDMRSEVSSSLEVETNFNEYAN